MKKLFLLIAILALAPGVAWGTNNYYACQAAQNLTGDNTWCLYAALESGSPAVCTKAAAGSYTAWATVAADNPTLYANGCTVVVNDSFTAVAISTADGGGGANDFAGGGFTLDMNAVTGKTITANITAGTTDCLAISGVATGKTLAIVGTVTGGTSTGADGIADTRTYGTITFSEGNILGNSGSNSMGWNQTGANSITSITGNVTAGAGAGAIGYSINCAACSATIAGDCIGGGATAGAPAPGCYGVSRAESNLVITGNIINGDYSTGAIGRFKWEPSSLAKYVVMDGGGTPIYASKAPAAANVAVGTSTVDWNDGSYDAGTKAGGGAWAN